MWGGGAALFAAVAAGWRYVLMLYAQLASRIIVLSPRPGRITAEFPCRFATRLLAGESSRTIKSDPAFIALREQVLAESELPIKLTAHSPCFRSEAGSEDIRGGGHRRRHPAGPKKKGGKLTSLTPGTGSTVRAAWFPT